MPGDLVDRVRQRLASGGVPITSAATAEAVRAEVGGVASDMDVLGALRVLKQEFVGAGVLDPLLRDPHTTDVLVTGPDQVWVDGRDGLRRCDVRFRDDDSVRRLAQRLALAAGRRLDDAQPYVDAWLPGGGPMNRIRLHAVLTPIAAYGTCLSLRVLRPAVHDLSALRGMGTFGLADERLLTAIVSARLAFLVVGPTASGKTTIGV